MTHEELKAAMLAFIETQDGEYDTEWYASPRDFAEITLSDFAASIGIVLDVPPFVRRKTEPEVSRSELMQQLMPEITKMFDIEYSRRMKETK
jgi:hypothetical protein